MANYLTTFDTFATYSAATVDYPNVSLILDEDKVYYQSEEPTPPTPPSFDGKFKLTYQDESVYSAECDSTSAITQSEITGGSGSHEEIIEAEIGDCVTSIGENAFQSCVQLSSINIPNGVTRIDSYAFKDCSGLTSVTMPSGITSIKYGTFQNCKSLTSLTIPSGVTTIEGAAFYYCCSLTSIVIPNGVTSINESTFKDCSGLTSVTIPDSVTSMGLRPFQNCKSLTSLTIPSGVTSIGMQAFDGCNNLTSVTVNATTPPTLGLYAFDTNNCPIYVPSESVETYKAASGWSTYADRIQAIP